MAIIRVKEIEYDENDKLVLTQKSCASCNRHEFCPELKRHLNGRTFTDDYTKLTTLMQSICDEYKTIYIEYPIEVEAIGSQNNFILNDDKNMGQYTIVTILVEDEKYDKELHLGLYLGMIPFSIMSTYNKIDKTILNSFMQLPAVFVFKYNKIFYGTQIKYSFTNINNIYQVSNKDCSLVNFLRNQYEQDKYDLIDATKE